jgi:hypothetical protein
VKKCRKSSAGDGVRLSLCQPDVGRAERDAYPERSETGPPMQSPPSSKYLKHPSRRASRESSEEFE